MNIKEKLIWGPFGPFKPYDLAPEGKHYFQRRAAESRSRFESAARVVDYLAGTTESLCAAITVGTLFGTSALHEARHQGLLPPDMGNLDNLKQLISDKAEELNLKERPCSQGHILEVLLIREDCIGGLALWKERGIKHASPVLPAPMTKNGLDVYYLGVELKWPPYTRTNPYSLLVKTGGGYGLR